MPASAASPILPAYVPASPIWNYLPVVNNIVPRDDLAALLNEPIKEDDNVSVGSVEAVEDLSADDIIRADIVNGVIRYSVRTSEMRENRRETPGKLERSFPGFYSGLADYWQHHHVRNVGNLEEHLLANPGPDTRFKPLVWPRLGRAEFAVFDDTDATAKSVTGGPCLAENNDALGPRSSRGRDLQ